MRPAPGPQTGPGGLSVDAGGGLDVLREADLVVVPAQRMPDYRPPRALVEALREAHRRGAAAPGWRPSWTGPRSGCTSR
ncbi:hypothetical protein ACFQXA_05260 [Nocardiopsis composta]